jgi:hypothetical protein
VVSHRRLNVSDLLMSSLLLFTVCLLLGGHLARQVHGTGLASQGSSLDVTRDPVLLVSDKGKGKTAYKAITID